MPAKPLPPDRTLSYPFVGFDILQDNYREAGDENEIGRTEDLYFGTEVTGRWACPTGCSARMTNALMLDRHGGARRRTCPTSSSCFSTGDFSTRVEDGRARNLITDAGAKYYWRWRPDWLLYAALSGTVTDSLDPDMQLLLGGDNVQYPTSDMPVTSSVQGTMQGTSGVQGTSGMRGYPLRYESGTSRAHIDGRAAGFHGLVSLSARARRGGGFRRRGQNVGQRRRSATVIPACCAM